MLFVKEKYNSVTLILKYMSSDKKTTDGFLNMTYFKMKYIKNLFFNNIEKKTQILKFCKQPLKTII